jgi:hypothetical protein
MKIFKYTLLVFLFSATSFFSFAQKEGVTKVEKFKPPVVKSFWGVNQNGALVTSDEATQLLAIPIKITDDKNNTYKVDSYQFLYRKKSYIQDPQTGKVVPTFTISSATFDTTPLPQIWIDNVKSGLKQDEQLYFFDVVVKDKQGRKFFAPDLKLTIK